MEAEAMIAELNARIEAVESQRNWALAQEAISSARLSIAQKGVVEALARIAALEAEVALLRQPQEAPEEAKE